MTVSNKEEVTEFLDWIQANSYCAISVKNDAGDIVRYVCDETDDFVEVEYETID